MIHARSLSKVFPTVANAVDGSDLSVTQSAIMGLLRPNDAGITTTTRTLSMLLGFDTGEGIIAGYNVDEESVKVCHTIGASRRIPESIISVRPRENLEIQGHPYRIKRPDIK